MKVILVIEDNQPIRENIAELLALENFYVITASNGREGINAALERTPDLILCDIMMPEISGYDVYTILNQYVLTAGLPFIFLTAKSEVNDRKNGISLGVDDYITKPFEPDLLISTIRNRIKKFEKTKSQTQYQLTDYVKELEDLLFMTSHQIRAPLCRCQGIVSLIESKEVVRSEDLTDLLLHVKTSLTEMDKFTRELTDFLHRAKQKKIEKLGKGIYNAHINEAKRSQS